MPVGHKASVQLRHFPVGFFHRPGRHDAHDGSVGLSHVASVLHVTRSGVEGAWPSSHATVHVRPYVFEHATSLALAGAVMGGQSLSAMLIDTGDTPMLL